MSPILTLFLVQLVVFGVFHANETACSEFVLWCSPRSNILLISRSIALHMETNSMSTSDTPLAPSSENAASATPEPSEFKVYKAPPPSSGPPRAFVGPASCLFDLLYGFEARELPESYFAPTAADLKAAQATLTARTQAMVNAPLQLRATREAVERAKKDRWPNVRRNLSSCRLSSAPADNDSRQI